MVEELKRLQVETETIVKIFEDPEVVRMIQTSRYCGHYFQYGYFIIFDFVTSCSFVFSDLLQ